MCTKGGVCVCGGVHNDFCARWGNWGGIIVVCAGYGHKGQKGQVYPKQPKEVQSQHHLGKKATTLRERVVGVDRIED